MNRRDAPILLYQNGPAPEPKKHFPWVFLVGVAALSTALVSLL